MQDNKQSTVSIYEVRKVDPSGKVLQKNIMSEQEVIHDLVNRKDLYQPITKGEVLNIIEQVKSQYGITEQPLSFYFLNKNNTHADIFTFLEEKTLH